MVCRPELPPGRHIRGSERIADYARFERPARMDPSQASDVARESWRYFQRQRQSAVHEGMDASIKLFGYWSGKKVLLLTWECFRRHRQSQMRSAAGHSHTIDKTFRDLLLNILWVPSLFKSRAHSLPYQRAPLPRHFILAILSRSVWILRGARWRMRSLRKRAAASEKGSREKSSLVAASLPALASVMSSRSLRFAPVARFQALSEPLTINAGMSVPRLTVFLECH